MLRKTIYIILGAVLSSLAVRAGGGATNDDLQLNTITTAVPFMAITPDSRAGAMGDAGTALGPYANSVYWNMSILNFAEERSAMSLSYTPWLRQLTNDIHLSYLSGYYKVNDQHVVGLSLIHISEPTRPY